MNEQDLEQELKSKGLNAARLTPEAINEVIVRAQYHVFPGTQTTVCCITTKNGFTVIGESVCVSSENYNAGIGEKVAYDNARDKIWALEGYLLKQLIN